MPQQQDITPHILGSTLNSQVIMFYYHGITLQIFL
jgi:hypothetical protein